MVDRCGMHNNNYDVCRTQKVPAINTIIALSRRDTGRGIAKVKLFREKKFSATSSFRLERDVFWAILIGSQIDL